MQNAADSSVLVEDDGLGLTELFTRLKRGLPVTLGLGLLGVGIACVAYAVSGRFDTATTATRVIFSFPGAEKGQYPDRSKFQPDDLRAPEIVSEALRRQGLATTEEFQSKIRGALSIEGIISPGIVKERDRLRAAGAPLPPYIPDEYTVSLTLPRSFPLNNRQRELFVNELVTAYRERFHRVYVDLPLTFGSGFDLLNNADYFDFELVLNEEAQNILTFLNTMAETARTFRSPRTGLSFGELQKRATLFIQLRMNETLGLIRQHGLSKDRKAALIKLDYYHRTLQDQAAQAMQEEKVVQDLLTQTRERMQNYVLGIRTTVAQQRPEAPIVDQGLIDSLLANDSYNFLVRQALEAGLKTRRLQSQIAVLNERRTSMKAFLESDQAEKAEVLDQMEKSLTEMKMSYTNLIADIRRTNEDYQRQVFGDAVRVSMQVITDSFYRGFIVSSIVGFAIGIALGLGQSLVRSTPARAIV